MLNKLELALVISSLGSFLSNSGETDGLSPEEGEALKEMFSESVAYLQEHLFEAAMEGDPECVLVAAMAKLQELFDAAQAGDEQDEDVLDPEPFSTAGREA